MFEKGVFIAKSDKNTLLLYRETNNFGKDRENEGFV